MKRLMNVLLVGGVIALTSCATQNVAIVGEGEGELNNTANDSHNEENKENKENSGAITPFVIKSQEVKSEIKTRRVEK